MNIGVFDSGLGGLAILRNFIRLLPSYNYIYLGDSLHVPYGGKTPEEIYELTCQAVKFLSEEKNCNLIILACNTSSSILPRIQQEFLPSYNPQLKVLGIIRPAAESIIESPDQPVGMMATKATVHSNSYIHELAKLKSKSVFYQLSCPALVPFIEAGQLDDEKLKQAIRTYVDILKSKGSKSIFLGCTHYEHIAELIKKIAGIPVITEGATTAQKLAEYLKRHPDIEKNITQESDRQYCFTHLDDNYVKLVKQFLGDTTDPNINEVTITS